MSKSFYICKHCQSTSYHRDDYVLPICCGDTMQKLTAKDQTDKLALTHIPIVDIEKNKLIAKVGDTPHPMTEEHHLMWVFLETNLGGQMRYLGTNANTTVEFNLEKDESPIAIYSYCNLHDLYKKDL